MRIHTNSFGDLIYIAPSLPFLCPSVDQLAISALDNAEESIWNDLIITEQVGINNCIATEIYQIYIIFTLKQEHDFDKARGY